MRVLYNSTVSTTESRLPCWKCARFAAPLDPPLSPLAPVARALAAVNVVSKHSRYQARSSEWELTEAAVEWAGLCAVRHGSVLTLSSSLQSFHVKPSTKTQSDHTTRCNDTPQRTTQAHNTSEDHVLPAAWLAGAAGSCARMTGRLTDVRPAYLAWSEREAKDATPAAGWRGRRL